MSDKPSFDDNGHSRAEQGRLPLFEEAGAGATSAARREMSPTDKPVNPENVGRSSFQAELEAESKKALANSHIGRNPFEEKPPEPPPPPPRVLERMAGENGAKAAVPGKQPIKLSSTSAAGGGAPAQPPTQPQRQAVAKAPTRHLGLETATSLGALLREARVKAGLSVGQVEAATKIKTHVIETLEQNDFSRLPPPIYVRAYIKSISELYGIDPEMAIKLMACPEQKKPSVPTAVIQELESGKQVNKEEEAKVERIAKSVIVLFTVAILAAAAGGWFFFKRHQAAAQTTAPAAAATATDSGRWSTELETLIAPETLPLREFPIPAAKH